MQAELAAGKDGFRARVRMEVPAAKRRVARELECGLTFHAVFKPALEQLGGARVRGSRSEKTVSSRSAQDSGLIERDATPTGSGKLHLEAWPDGQSEDSRTARFGE